MPSLLAPSPRLPVACLILAALVGGATAGGCTSYEYDIVRPAELAQHVGTEKWVTARQDPLEYRFVSAESHLVMQVHNRTPDPVQLLGDRSVLVDPKGQSHSFRSQTIAPGSFLKLILPPLAAQVERSGPRIGFGIGLGFGSARQYGRYRGRYGSGFGYDDPFWDEPRYYAIYDPNDATYWRWDGEAGEVRATLVYDVAGKLVTHEFAFRRKKA
jgi:hypothetical protein